MPQKQSPLRTMHVAHLGVQAHGRAWGVMQRKHSHPRAMGPHPVGQVLGTGMYWSSGEGRAHTLQALPSSLTWTRPVPAACRQPSAPAQPPVHGSPGLQLTAALGESKQPRHLTHGNPAKCEVTRASTGNWNNALSTPERGREPPVRQPPPMSPPLQ